MDAFFPSERTRLFVTCEHADYRIPAEFARRFTGSETVRRSHRGYDPGALHAAKRIAAHFRAPLVFSDTSRLLVDLNRSIGHPFLFSKWTAGLDPADRRKVLRRWYFPYRRTVEKRIASEIRTGSTVLHLSVHSFSPLREGRRRRMDLGLLYDPSRDLEARFCQAWQRQIRGSGSAWKVYRNAPYRGVSDGLTTALRRKFNRRVYLGIELEINQAHCRGRGGRIEESLIYLIIRSLERLVGRG